MKSFLAEGEISLKRQLFGLAKNSMR